ncbi:MAG: phenylalanine--tRNA ligase subunit beta [Sphingomonadales bacterium]|nr:phenylalanine--tRNA ligase subunit beta [Sphingomonadales bacterium]
MKFTLSWLKDHLDTEASIEVLTTRLSSIGLEVEGVDDPAKALGSFVIGRVLKAEKHPNADKLQVCQVDTGSGVFEVVCGAPNARTGLVGVFAPVGSYIPGTQITLDKRPVRGVVSNGMLLSEREMQLSDDHEGIVDLGDAAAADIGKRYADVMGLNDPVIEVKLTPNRPDCTGVRGIARDLAACGLGKLKPEPEVAGVEGAYECPINIELTFPNGSEDACPCFAGRYIRGIKNGSSPAWMQRRLKAVGLRPINAVVDVTNYISLDRGRPLHVYDADKLVGAIRSRLGEKGETFLGLDGKTYEADETMCVIADDRAVLGFGGIMGGEETGCTHETRNVLIECAYFDPLRTAATGRKVGLQTDARYRFERGVDPAYIEPGLDLATRMMMDVAGGTPSKARIAGRPPIKTKVISFNFGRIEKLAGLKLPEPEVRRTLDALGFAVGGKGPAVDVTAPTWRPDVHGAADLVEEVARIYGLDAIPSAAMPRAYGVARPVLTEKQRRVRRARRLLAGRGLVETITWSFITHTQAGLFGGGQKALELANPISSEMSDMRPSLLPSLLEAAQKNRNHGHADLSLFELGQVYRGDRPEDQFMIAGGVRAGTVSLAGAGRLWDGSAREADFFEVKADVFALLSALGVDPARAQIVRDTPPWFHPGRSASLKLGPKVVLAHFGEVHPRALGALDVAGPVAAFEVFLDALPTEKRKARTRPVFDAANLLPVTRDFAFVVGKDIPAGDVVRAALAVDKALIASVSVFDVFEGGSLGANKKSLAIAVTLAPKDKTLTDPEIEAISAKIVAEVQRATGGQIRS